MAHVMTLKTEGFVVEVHMVNPGHLFKPFGGSKSGLAVEKTASLITRIKDNRYGIKDVEYDIDDPTVWKWFDELINWHGATVVSAQPCEDQTEKPKAA